MEWLYPLVLPTIAAIALLYFGLGLFNVPWLMRIRILAALGVGALLVGAGGYGLLHPADPLGAVSVLSGRISMTDAAVVIGLAFLAGGLATLVCYPLGSVLGPYAAPAGLGVVALCTGGITQLLLTNSALEQRNTLYGLLRIESLLWLAVCAAGFAGVWIATRLIHKKTVVLHPEKVPQKKNEQWINALIAAVVAAGVVYFCIGLLVRDVRQIDTKLGSVTGIPGNAQIAFGVFVAVGLAGFLAKRFLQTHYIPVIVGALALYIGVFTKLISSETLGHIVRTWNIYYFPHAIYAITPIQFVSFCVLGAMTGYWIAMHVMQKAAAEPKADNLPDHG